MSKLSHFDARGQAQMVDIAEKPDTHRVAKAVGRIRMLAATLKEIVDGTAKKGDVLGVARIAAIQGSKRASEFIPLCHPLSITRVNVDFAIDHTNNSIECMASVETVGKTGVEMEALTAVSIALLTIYDMCKAIDRGMQISNIELREKQGGKSGHWVRNSGE